MGNCTVLLEKKLKLLLLRGFFWEIIWPVLVLIWLNYPLSEAQSEDPEVERHHNTRM